MKKTIISLFWFLFVIVLGACSASSGTSEVPIAVQPTDTAFISLTSTAPIVPTVDPLTPTAIAQFFHTLEAITITPEATAIPNYDECSQWGLFASNDDWTLCNPMVDPITLIDKANQFWQFSYKAHYGKEVLDHCTRLLYSTDDGNYLYFSLDADCIMADPGFVSSISVFRINLINGDVSEILKASYDFGSYTGNYYTVSISPTGRRLAYITDQDRPLKINLLDLKTGEKHSFSIEDKYTFGGAYTWSEDGTKLVFRLESKTDNDHFISMVFLDLLKKDSMATFIKDKEYSWIISRIEITDHGVKVTPIDGESLFYDIETGILSPASK